MMSWSSQKKKKKSLLFQNETDFTSMYRALNKLLEYRHFCISQNITSYAFCLFLKLSVVFSVCFWKLSCLYKFIWCWKTIYRHSLKNDAEIYQCIEKICKWCLMSGCQNEKKSSIRITRSHTDFLNTRH